MNKMALLLAGSFFVFSSCMASNCGQALPRDSAGFCASFKSIAICHCTNSGLPAQFCNDVRQIYSRMITVFGSQQKACSYQRDTTVQDCMDDWNCYRLGGRDSLGKMCNTTGSPCP